MIGARFTSVCPSSVTSFSQTSFLHLQNEGDCVKPNNVTDMD